MSDKTPEQPDTEAAQDTGAAAGGKPKRRTASAPVRKAKATPEADDKVIDELESDFDGEPAQPVSRKTAKAPVKKARPTRKRRDAKHEEQDPYGPTTPVNFTKQAAAELKKVVWPTRTQLFVYFAAVLVFVLFIIAFVGILDFAFGWSLLALLGA